MNNLFFSFVFIFLIITFPIRANADISSSMKACDLELLVGLPFIWQESQSFHIDHTNSKGEAVGTAYFKNANPLIGNPEIIGWYWHPENGFYIISSRTELLNAYGKDILKTPFQFYKLMINESGVIAGSFLVDQVYGQDNKKFNQYAWLCWSFEAGLHLSELPSQCQTVEGINDLGFILIEHNTSFDFTLIIKNINQQDHSQNLHFSPHGEISSSSIETEFEKFLRNLYGQVHHDAVIGKNILKFSILWYPFTSESFDNTLKINGRGTCTVRFVKGIYIDEWFIEIGYEICNGKAIFYLKKITGMVTHGLPNLTFPEKSTVIYEKEI